MFVALLQGWREIVPSSLLDNSRIFATVWRWECGAAGMLGHLLWLCQLAPAPWRNSEPGPEPGARGHILQWNANIMVQKICDLIEHSLSKTWIFFRIFDKLFTPEALGRGCRSGQRYVERRPGPGQSWRVLRRHWVNCQDEAETSKTQHNVDANCHNY